MYTGRLHGHYTTVGMAQHTAVYTVLYTAMYTGRDHGRVWAVYTRTRPCTRSVHVYTARVHGFVHGHVHVYTARTRPLHGR